MICGSAVYKAYALDWAGIAGSLVLAGLLFAGLLLITENNNQPEPKARTDKSEQRMDKILPVFSAAYILLLGLTLYLLFQGRTDASLVSMWKFIPGWVFITYALAGLSLVVIMRRRPEYGLTGLIPYYLLSFSAALIVYELGYGFDPFVHEATLEVIDQAGAVDPKPWYYLGQYSLILVLHKLLAIPIAWLNQALVPILAGLFLPPVLWRTMQSWFPDARANLLTILALLVFPFSFFIVTTPQNLAFLWLVLALLYGLTCRSTRDLVLVYALALAALANQPVAGLPALFFAFALTLYHSGIPYRLKRIFYGINWLAAALSLPAAFVFVESQRTGKGLAGLALPEITKIFSLSPPRLPSGENSLLGLVYLYGFNLKFVVVAIGLIGAFLAWRYRKYCRLFGVYLFMSGALIMAYLVTKLLPFSFIISYERSDYADRILLVAGFLLLPFLLTAFYAFFIRLRAKDVFVRSALTIFLLTLITASFYLSYPRKDDFHNSHFHSVGQTDLMAVEWINNQADNNYIVLANQQVSAAALHKYGFDHYYRSDCSQVDTTDDAVLDKCQNGEEIFYYPIPTGGALYQYYLSMVYDYPKQATAQEAMRLTGTKQAYLVINDYWWAADRIMEEAKLEADGSKSINNGKIWIFKFTR